MSKKNLLSLNPDIDLATSITNLTHTEFVVKLSRLVTAKIPINILPPTGETPVGYEYLDYWPQKLTQTLSGPEEEIQKLKTRGLDFTFDLSDITVSDLDPIKSGPDNFHDDEIRFLVPPKWKKVIVPFHNNALEEINDPEAQNMRVYFLHKQVLPLEREIPLAIFYPLTTSDSINPETVKLIPGKYIHIQNSIPLFTVPLYVKDVSKLFLSVVRDNLQIALVAAPQKEREILEWSVEVINPNELEDTYVAYLITNLTSGKGGQSTVPKKREMLIRKRFRDYLQRLTLYTGPEQKLSIESSIEDGQIHLLNY